VAWTGISDLEIAEANGALLFSKQPAVGEASQYCSAKVRGARWIRKVGLNLADGWFSGEIEREPRFRGAGEGKRGSF
jgi:hypothetical protein